MFLRYGLAPLPSNNLSASELSKLVQDTADKVTTFGRSNGKETVLIAHNNQLLRLLPQFQEAQTNPRPQTVVSQLEQADMERDQAFKTLYSFIKAHAYLKTATIQKAFGLLNDLFKAYNKALSKSYEVQTTEITKLLSKLKTSDYQAAVNQLNLSTYLTDLEAAQTKFETLYQQRLREQATANPGKAKTARRELEKTYKLVVDLVAIHAYAQPDHVGYQDLLKQINAIRGRYKKRPRKEKETTSA